MCPSSTLPTMWSMAWNHRVAGTGLGAAIGRDPHAEGGGVVVRCLLGVAHDEVDVVDSLDREGVGVSRSGRSGDLLGGVGHDRRLPIPAVPYNNTSDT